MANTIITKNSATATAVPTSGELVQGELAVNVTDKRIFTENSGGTVVELGVNPSSVTTGNATVGGTLGVTGLATLASSTLTANPTLSSGTANGVAYLNGSKVLTSGSALTFNGSVLDVTGTVTADGLTVATSSAVTASFSRDGSDGDVVQIFNGVAGSTKALGLGVSGTHGTISSQFGGVYIQPAGATSAFFASGGDVSFYEDTGTTAKFFWDASAESLGIGTSSPNYALTISSAAPRIRQVATTGTNNSLLQLENTGGNAFIGLDSSVGGLTTAYALNVFHSGAYPIVFSTNNTERLRLDSSGRLLINRTSATGALSLEVQAPAGFSIGSGFHSASTQSTIEFKDSTTTANYKVRVGSAGDALLLFAGGTERVRITSAGDFLVGTQSSVGSFPARLELQGNTSNNRGINYAASVTGTVYAMAFNNPNGFVGSIAVSASSTAYNTSSDYRLKEDWVAVSDASTRVNALKPVNFAWIASGERVDGFLAHELADVVPEAVTGTKDAVDADGNPEYQGIDQSKLVPLLTAALQEALAAIESLTARISALEGN